MEAIEELRSELEDLAEKDATRPACEISDSVEPSEGDTNGVLNTEDGSAEPIGSIHARMIETAIR